MQSSHTPSRAGFAAPESGERNPPASVVPPKSQCEKQHRDFAFNATADQAAFAELSARAVARRCALYALADGGYVVTRTGWGLSKTVPDLQSVVRLLALMEHTA